MTLSLKKQRDRIAKAHQNKHHFDELKDEVQRRRQSAKAHKTSSVGMPEIERRARQREEMQVLQDKIRKNRAA